MPHKGDVHMLCIDLQHRFARPVIVIVRKVQGLLCVGLCHFVHSPSQPDPYSVS